MFFLQLIMVVVMPLMGPAVQEASFHSLSCFHPAKGHNPSYAATEEVLRVLLPQELCGGGQGPSALLLGSILPPWLSQQHGMASGQCQLLQRSL